MASGCSFSPGIPNQRGSPGLVLNLLAQEQRNVVGLWDNQIKRVVRASS